MVVHLKLENHSEEYVDVVRMCVHDYVENPFLLYLSETKQYDESHYPLEDGGAAVEEGGGGEDQKSG